ncbi:hypothetical protein ACVWWQ_001977 [Rhodanobacter sp. TND4EL1]
MKRYLRLKDVPELHAVAAADRRAWWREAVSRSNTARGIWLTLPLFFVCISGIDAIRRWLGYDGELLHFAGLFVGSMLGSLINAYWLIQPRAREWLQSNLTSQSEQPSQLSSQA